MAKKASTSSEGSEILRRKKEMLGVISNSVKKFLLAGKTKRMNVVKHRVPQNLIDYMLRTPNPILDEIPEHELAKRSQAFRDTYAGDKDINDKIRAYFLALLDQYKAQGYAEDESEVTDDEEETVS
nr:unnamed protein product [Digitaria exilis]